MFFTDRDSINEEEKKLIITEDAYHIARSLRMAVGDTVSVSDKCGTVYRCALSFIRDSVCECEILEKEAAKSEPAAKITLYMAYPKGDKLEYIIQKAVELGVSRIVPFESERCIKRPREDKLEKQNDRLSKIALEAAKQCGRAIIPTVSLPLSYDKMLSEAKKAELALFCYEGEGAVSLKKALRSQDSFGTVSVTVGSEGGFSEKEFIKAKEAGLVPVNLGPRILRCETAPLYALTALSYEMELDG